MAAMVAMLVRALSQYYRQNNCTGGDGTWGRIMVFRGLVLKGTRLVGMVPKVMVLVWMVLTRRYGSEVFRLCT